MKEHLLKVVDRFPKTRVVVLADLVLDEFLHGEIARVSREAPVLIIDYKRMDAMPGGGANAIRNVRALGGEPIPVGVVGQDDAGERLRALLDKDGIDTTGVIRISDYATPVKTRVLAGLPHSRTNGAKMEFREAAPRRRRLASRGRSPMTPGPLTSWSPMPTGRSRAPWRH